MVDVTEMVHARPQTNLFLPQWFLHMQDIFLQFSLLTLPAACSLLFQGSGQHSSIQEFSGPLTSMTFGHTTIPLYAPLIQRFCSAVSAFMYT